jgi:uncharacterized protein (DUF4213/DUF364 family)
MTLQAEFLELISRLDSALDIPRVARIYVPPDRPVPEKQADFGILTLADGSSGLFYTMLGSTGEDCRARIKDTVLTGRPAAEIAMLYESEEEVERSLGLAAINAITAFVYRKRGYQPEFAGDSIGELNLAGGDHLGMVGYFKPLVERLKSFNVRITLLEKKTDISDLDEAIRLQHDPACLNECNKILCTASTLLNNSLESILSHTRKAETMVIIGPTAGFFPDPLFRRSVTAIGGSRVVDAEHAIRNLQQGSGLGNSVTKFLIKKSDYPGIARIAGLDMD